MKLAFPPIEPCDKYPAEVIDKARFKLAKSRAMLLASGKNTFLTMILLRLPVHLVNTPQLTTAAVDYSNVYFSIDFVLEHDISTLTFVQMHEVLHPLYENNSRLGTRNPEVWNQATDYVNNSILIKAGYPMPKMPDGKPLGLYDSKFDNMTAEQVYEKLVQDPSNQKSNSIGLDIIYDNTAKQEESQNTNQNGSGESAEDLEVSEEELAAAKQAFDDLVQQSLIEAEKKNDTWSSSGSPEHARLLERLAPPEVDWKKQLRKYAFELSGMKRTWKRFNRRMLPMGIHLQGRQRQVKFGNVEFHIDVSGSVNESMFNTFCSNVHYILQELKPNKITLHQFDTRIIDSTELKTARDLLTKVEFRGGGGTSIYPSLRALAKSNAKVAIIITDGYFESLSIQDNPNIPVIWVIFDNPQWTAPFGKVIHLKE